MKQRRALILYATMSSNTEKIARCIADVFDAYNWDVTTVRIRNQAELALRQDLIIACGGGLPLRPDCIASLKYSGVVFWRDRDPGETYDMLDVSGRPLAQQGRDAFLARYAQRAPIYESWADYVIRGADSAEAAARMILDILQREENCT